jgi:hypothetical protein
MFRPGGFLVPIANGEFLMNNITLGFALWLLGDAIDTTRNTDARQHSIIHPRFGSGRRITHPGDSVVGVMTAHPACLQSQYVLQPGGLSPRLEDVAAEGVTRRRCK